MYFTNIHELDLELGDGNHLPENARVQIATKHTMHIFRLFSIFCFRWSDTTLHLHISQQYKNEHDFKSV